MGDFIYKQRTDNITEWALVDYKLESKYKAGRVYIYQKVQRGAKNITRATTSIEKSLDNNIVPSTNPGPSIGVYSSLQQCCIYAVMTHRGHRCHRDIY